MYPIIIVFSIILIDQYIKFQIIKKIMPIRSIEVIQNFFYLTYVENHGIAFGLFKNKNLLFIVLTSIIIIALLYLIYRLYKGHILISICMSLIVGGAVGNLIDRIRLNYVVDYLHFTFFPPVFNFADASIVSGAILLSLILLFDKSITI